MWLCYPAQNYIHSLLQPDQYFFVFLLVFRDRHDFRLEVGEAVEPVGPLHRLVLLQTASKGVQEVLVESVLIYLALLERYRRLYQLLLQLLEIYLLEELVFHYVLRPVFVPQPVLRLYPEQLLQKRFRLGGQAFREGNWLRSYVLQDLVLVFGVKWRLPRQHVVQERSLSKSKITKLNQSAAWL